MRYLKVIAQDRTDSGQADAVLLNFYEQRDGAQDDVLLNQAIATARIAGGKLDCTVGDVNNNSRETSVDRRLLDIFANNYLKLKWLNQGHGVERYMKVFARDLHADGSPDSVHLELHEGEGASSGKTLVSWHAAFDTDNNGLLESIVYGDADQNQHVDAADRAVIQSLANVFLKFNWK
ncbi:MULTISPECIES: hypothetical protein [unclassified Pseudomonas]|uniref:hypothetical protein n=1 Tax=Pseudomonas TaxID=286 RepID=UPI000BA12EDC|nr:MULTISPECIES: hypothetical protein [unclassified Pseudomonas]MCV2225725.1 hypothetical protein [Pseudomonas sp. AU10]OZO06061.1 hypothetical protein B7453_03105 [Pseudomonas sp. IB20]UXZ22506.1 hypothetical protein KZH41_29310 [Pseudomonas sp. YeP6b]